MQIPVARKYTKFLDVRGYYFEFKKTESLALERISETTPGMGVASE